MPVEVRQYQSAVSAANVTSLPVTLPQPPREGNTLVLITNGDGGTKTDLLVNAGWTFVKDADNITGLYAHIRVVEPDASATVTPEFVAPVSAEAALFELTSTADDPLDVSASDTSAPSFTTEVTTGSTSPEFSGMSQADEFAIAAFARSGSGFAASAFTNGFAAHDALTGLGSNPTGVIIATRSLPTQLSAVESTATISGGTLAPAGLLLTVRARQAGFVGRTLREQYEEAPNAQTVEITNSGTGTLTWTATPDSDWLTDDPASGTAPSVLTVAVSPLGLTADTYTGEITVAGAGASNTPQTLPVSFTVGTEIREVSSLLVEPFRIIGPEGGSLFTSLVVSNRTMNGCTLTFNSNEIFVNTSNIKQLHAALSRLAVEANGSEVDDQPAVIEIEPMEGTHQ